MYKLVNTRLIFTASIRRRRPKRGERFVLQARRRMAAQILDSPELLMMAALRDDMVSSCFFFLSRSCIGGLFTLTFPPYFIITTIYSLIFGCD